MYGSGAFRSERSRLDVSVRDEYLLFLAGELFVHILGEGSSLIC